MLTDRFIFKIEYGYTITSTRFHKRKSVGMLRDKQLSSPLRPRKNTGYDFPEIQYKESE